MTYQAISKKAKMIEQQFKVLKSRLDYITRMKLADTNEQLKELEREAMDNLNPDNYEAIVSNVLDAYDQEIYQSGYIDGLQTAIRMLSENDSTMSYSIDVEDIFPEDDDTSEEEGLYGAED